MKKISLGGGGYFRKVNLLLLMISIFTFSIFYFNKQTYSYNEFNEEDVYISYVVNGEKTTSMPSYNAGYLFSEESFCNNGVKIKFDNTLWTLSLDFSNFSSDIL